MARTLKLTIAYDGTNYAGWQRQINGLGIQQVLEEEIATIVGAHHPLNAAGRTDSGVHAAGQVASITLDHSIGCPELQKALNARLKAGDIRIRAIEEMPDRWDARIFAKSKTYRYAIWNGPTPSPFLRQVVWHVAQPLDLDRMARAASALIGEQDFVTFQGRGTDVKTTVRRVISAAILEKNIHSDQPIALSPLDPSTSPGANGAQTDEGRLFRFEISATGFLRHMVRTIVGTLADIGRGQLPVEEMAAIIEARDRRRAGHTAPPHGLMLWKVNY
jgi:tRNA pseudouridine38-40 synthase